MNEGNSSAAVLKCVIFMENFELEETHPLTRDTWLCEPKYADQAEPCSWLMVESSMGPSDISFKAATDDHSLPPPPPGNDNSPGPLLSGHNHPRNEQVGNIKKEVWQIRA